MDDGGIVELFFARDENALAETQKKYGGYCAYIARSILGSEQDAEECVNDAYISVWNSIPPHRPQLLRSYIGKIVRNIAINRYARSRAQKRARQTELILDELAEVIPGPERDDPASDDALLGQALNGFLQTLGERQRVVFVRRYWYLSAIKDIAADCGLGESNVKVMLLRTRRQLRAYLEKEGISI